MSFSNRNRSKRFRFMFYIERHPLKRKHYNIGKRSIQSCKAITSVTVPNSVTDMGTSIFDGCTELLSATLGTGVFSVPNYTFNNCSKLATIVLSENITSIGQYASKIVHL